MTQDTLTCDVFIVGGGPAGLSVAAALPDDVKCVIVHQDKEIGLPVRSSGGSWLRDVKRLGVPDDMYQIVARADAYSDNVHSHIPLGDETVVILNTPKLYKWLAAQSDHKDRQLLLATKFLTTRQRPDGMFLSDVRGRDGAVRQVVSRYIVDGSGWHMAVLGALGLAQKPERLGVGTEYEYPLGENPPDRAIIFVGTNVLSGYGWAYPTAKGTIRVGVGVIQPESDANPRKLLDVVVNNKTLLKRYGLMLPDTPAEVHSGILPSVAYEKKLVYGNAIRVGDAANVATPALGEGIRQSIKFGRMAGEALGKAIKTGRSGPLKAYERRAHRQLARNYKWGFLVNTRYAKMTPPQWDSAVRRIGAMGSDAAVAVLRSEFPLLKTMRMSWGIARMWLRRRFLKG